MNFSELFPDEDYRFHMGLQRGTPEDFFQPADKNKSILSERRRWLEKDLNACCALLPAGVPLFEECLELARGWQSITAREQQLIIASTSPLDCCRQLAELWEPDFLLLKADAEGRFRLLGGGVCFPSAWSLAEKIGQPMEFIHGPVPGLNAQLGRSIDSFLAKLAPGPAWLRRNWGLSSSAELNQHPTRALPRLHDAVTLGEVWLRVEHQALVALPRSEGVLFGIRIAMYRLEEVARVPEFANNLARALRTMPEPVAAYKGLSTARERVIKLLSQP
jgi:dimethylamine monooxygenase subunit A